MKDRIGVVQMTSTANVKKNIDTCRILIDEAAEEKVRLLCFPENFYFMGEKDDASLEIAEPIHGPTISRFQSFAQDHAMWLSLGGFQLQSDEKGKVHNAHIVIDAKGSVRAVYKKIHLFSARLGNKQEYHENKFTSPGDELEVLNSPVGHLGLSICYDLRFPEMYGALTKMGAEVLLVPAAFTETTGKAHWETLLRARAIENQCYVAAAAQTGKHNTKRRTHGHAMIIDPWGNVIAQCSEGTRLAIADLDLRYQHDLRERMPVLKHKRQDIFRSH